MERSAGTDRLSRGCGQRARRKIKKKLEIDPIQAETVRRVYQMALNGVNNNGSMGLKSIATWLDENKIRTRDGGRWGLGAVHMVLTRTTYIGHHRFNTRDHKTRTPKPESEHAVMEVPVSVSEAEFEAVQRSLKARNPKMMAPMAVGGPTLLTGICFCACCGGAMTLRTGTSSLGREYRYYTCSTKARQGATGCPGITVPMDRLNERGRSSRSATARPGATRTLMDQILERRDEWVNQRRQHVADLERATEAEAKLKRLYDAIENGVIDVSDPSLKDRIAELTATREQAKGDAERTMSHIMKIGPAITPESLRAFAAALRKKLRNGDGTFVRDQVRAVAQRVEVVSRTEVRIRGQRSELLRTLTAASGVEAAVLGVRAFEPNWCA